MTASATDMQTGVAGIDAAHERIFALMNNFGGGASQIGVGKSLALLCEYVKDHFREEEALMSVGRYAGLSAHRQHHHVFRTALLVLLDKAKTQSLDRIGEEVRVLIDGWLPEHMRVFDSEFARWQQERALCV